MKKKFLRCSLAGVLIAIFLCSAAAYALSPDIGEYYRTMGLAEEITYPTAREKKGANIRGINNNDYCYKAGQPNNTTMFWSTIMKNDGTTAATSVHKDIYQGGKCPICPALDKPVTISSETKILGLSIRYTSKALGLPMIEI